MGLYPSQYPPYFANQTSASPAIRAHAMVAAQPQSPPPYVDHQNAKKVRNDVNVHKDTLKLEVEEQNPDHHLVSFVFDALFDGSRSIMHTSSDAVPVFEFLSSNILAEFTRYEDPHLTASQRFSVDIW